MKNKLVLTASVVITTKNRKNELRAALNSVVAQSTKIEVIVIDDGSTDGTEDMVKSEFPQAILHRFEESKGLVVRRNDGARLATGDIIFSIDDDAIFSTSKIIEQTLMDFNNSRIAAVAIPYIDINKDRRPRQIAPDNKKIWLAHAYIGTAHAYCRNVFLKLKGYREHLVHQGEESDYCIRMLAEGYVVRIGNADPIYHFESPKRNCQRMDFYGCRNSILFAWQNVPMPDLSVYLMATTFNCLRWTLNPRRLLVRLMGIMSGYRDCLLVNRAPVRRSIYQYWRKLKQRSATQLKSEIA